MTDSIFHQGDLQSGIASAIQQQKLVACFIRADDDPTSTLWEGEWLAEVSDAITEKAVLLRIESGSEEAGFLGAFCSIEKAPTLVIIHNGRVLEKLEENVGREEFTGRVLNAISLGGDADESGKVEGELQQEKEMRLGDDTATSDVAQVTSQAAAAITSALGPKSSQVPPSTVSAPLSIQDQTPSTLFPDRSARLAAEKAQRDAAEKAARDTRLEARKREAEEAFNHHRGDKGKGRATDVDPDKQRARDQWIYQQKIRKDEAKKERERILERIEADKAERRLRTQRARDAAVAGDGAIECAPPESRIASSRRSAGAGGTCQLLIRLFDGSSIRGRFATTSTLGKEVRDWIREQAPKGSGGADIPFTFRQILAPNPSRSIEMGEEMSSLLDLELAPSATLVLVPVAGSVDAYAASDASWVGWGYNLASSTAARASYFLPSFSRLYLGGTGDPEEGGNSEGAAMAGADSSSAGAEGAIGRQSGNPRVKSLADQQAESAKKQRTEFYNGNSLGTVGRRGEDGEQEEK
ncbi:hypothetical protein LTR62_004654 [Meristemomyces frigidus]|uniref:UBX domain-containing protein n=1 Tax=Meristemomyces frigidus TaxID=1508187 RepID=A0AAN7YFY9_9PEZI|nr:hypothetical protein LTR62_004654 [Meristemomyces frigidus]